MLRQVNMLILISLVLLASSVRSTDVACKCPQERLTGSTRTTQWTSSSTLCNLVNTYNVSGHSIKASNTLVDFSKPITSGTSIKIPISAPPTTCPFIVVALPGEFFWSLWNRAAAAKATTATLNEVLAANPQTYKAGTSYLTCGDQVLIPCGGTPSCTCLSSNTTATCGCSVTTPPVSPTATPTATPQPTPLLQVNGNKLLLRGKVVQLRGVNILDPNNCVSCVNFNDFSVSSNMQAAAIAKMDEAVNNWGANLLRLNLAGLKTPTLSAGPNLLNMGASYFSSIKAMAQRATSYNKDVILMVSIQYDLAGHDFERTDGVPNDATVNIWNKLTPLFSQMPHVMFGIVNEPGVDEKSTVALAAAKAQFEKVVQAIRAAEASTNSIRHVISVQGLSGFARKLDYYVSNRIQDTSVVYETHVYGGDCIQQVIGPYNKGLPVIVGELGPDFIDKVKPPFDFSSSSMTSVTQCMSAFQSYSIPYMAWIIGSSKCDPSLLDTSGDRCDNSSSVYTPSSPWGQTVKRYFTS